MYSLRITQNAEDAHEVCQEALLKIFRYLDKYRSEMNLKNWIYQIVANAARDHLRKRNKRELCADPQYLLQGDRQSSPEDSLLQVEIRDRLQACIRFLTPKERIVFVLRDVEGHSVRETASLLRMSSVSVRTHLSRARCKLRIRYEEIYPEGLREDKT
ncbi:MAG: sigma-70 family RNA polymerase sigma factor [Candidatus Aminicenantes bacterium]|nr:sigma-70 family RNA polymerase sigma factor [Candidatus Aminicenantes bacterium]